MNGFRVVVRRSFSTLAIPSRKFPLILPATVALLLIASRASATTSLVRIHTAEQREIGGRTMSTTSSGAVVAQDSSAISLRSESGKTEVIPLSSITGIDRYVGTVRHTETGALIGAGAGLLLGYAYGSGVDDVPVVHALEENVSGFAWSYAAIGAGVGAIVGAMVGNLTETDLWEPANLSDIHVGVNVNRTGDLGVALNATF
jgi:hypothetical protein